MSARLGYPLVATAADVTRGHQAPEHPLHGRVDVEEFGEVEDLADAWHSNVQANKYSGSVGPQQDGDAATQEAITSAAAAGLPYFTPAKLAEIEAQLQADPRLDDLKAALLASNQDPEAAQTRAWSVAQALVQDDSTLDVWSLLVLAMRHALNDHGEALRYDLDRLEMYSTMAAQMSQYTTMLQDAQQALDIKLNGEKDDLKRAFIEVPLPDRREYLPDSFFALTPDGTLRYNQLAQQPAATPSATALDAKNEGYTPIWKFGFGKIQQNFVSPDGRKWLGRGETEDERRANVMQQIGAKNQEDADNANMVSTSGLGLRVQIYTQQREQLQKLSDKWQMRFQTDNEVKNQTAAAITSVLKNLHDMQSATTRNLQ